MNKESLSERLRHYEDDLMRHQKELLALSKEETIEKLEFMLEKRSDCWLIKVQEIFTKIILYTSLYVFWIMDAVEKIFSWFRFSSDNLFRPIQQKPIFVN